MPLKTSIKRLFLIIADVIFVLSSYMLGYFVYFNFSSSSAEVEYYFDFIYRAPIIALIFIVLFFLFRLYNNVWRYAGTYELVMTVSAAATGTVLSFILDYILWRSGLIINTQRMIPLGVYVIAFFCVITLCGGIRFLYRFLRTTYVSGLGMVISKSNNRVMLIGAGDMGNLILKEFRANPQRKGSVVVMVDDSRFKQGKRIEGVPILGGCSKIPEIAAKYKVDEIVLCIPTLTPERRHEIMEIALKTGCQLKTCFDLGELSETEEENWKKLRDVDVSDLLSRSEVTLDTKVCEYLEGSVVLVTGGGGSIGSELCRQSARYAPKKIVIFDIYENNAFALKNALDNKYHGSPEVDIRIGSVREPDRLNEVFDEFKPDVVFHAAAHKHVPLMEDSPCEAIKNNIFGTYNTAKCAMEHKVKKFVLLSTDKAVNPTNVMGATKRFAELTIQHFNSLHSDTVFAAVRFGNVLGSNGSVIPIFKDQIASGGPVTVTHPDITRYFMTIPEASQLVVQAGGLAVGGEIFVLDMGEPVKILSLAENLIRLSGLVPYEDIKIEFTGLRPGEKLYEELSLEEELAGRHMTSNNKIFVTSPMQFDDKVYLDHLKAFEDVSPDNVRHLIKDAVPNFSQNQPD